MRLRKTLDMQLGSHVGQASGGRRRPSPREMFLDVFTYGLSATPGNFNMKPENGPLEDYFPLQPVADQ